MACIGLYTQPTIAQSGNKRVLAAHPVIYGLAQQLAHNTSIDIVQAAPAKLPAARQPSYFMGRGLHQLLDHAKKADAVLTMRSIWSDDMLYPLARRSNIRLVEIDVAQPIEQSTAGVALNSNEKALIERPWLHTGNMLRMSSIMAESFVRLYPSQKKQIQKNLTHIKKRIAALDAKVALALAKAKNLSTIVLSKNTNTLALAANLDIIPWQAPRKRKELLAQLPQLLKKENAKIVLSNRKPHDSIAQVIQSNGAQFVLVPRFYGDPITQLEKIYTALIQATSK